MWEWEAELKAPLPPYVEQSSARSPRLRRPPPLLGENDGGVGALAELVGGGFEHVLVDEYQDTNALQAKILLRMKPDGRGLTVVGDDAQSIYSSGRPRCGTSSSSQAIHPPARVVTLEQNYRSTEPILEAATRSSRKPAMDFERSCFQDEPVRRATAAVTADDEAGTGRVCGRAGTGASRSGDRSKASRRSCSVPDTTAISSKWSSHGGASPSSNTAG